VYVNRAVNLAQIERQASDSLTFSNPAMATTFGRIDGPVHPQLGFDPNLFVQHEVRSAQGEARFLNNIVNGRLDRLNLSSEHLLLTPGLFQTNGDAMTYQQILDIEAAQKAGTIDQPASPPEAPAAPLAMQVDAQDPANPQKALHSRTALSFSAQLQKGSIRLPASTRATATAAKV